MANLYSGVIDTKGSYNTVTELTEVTFTENTTYTIQVLNPAWVREGTEGTGFYLTNNKPFQYTAGSDDLYIRTDNTVTINIAS